MYEQSCFCCWPPWHFDPHWRLIERELEPIFQVMDKVKLGTTYRSLFAASRSFIESETHYRAEARVQVFDLPRGLAEYHHRLGGHANDQGVWQIRACRETLEEARKTWDPKMFKEFDEASKRMQKELGEAKSIFIDQLHKLDFSPEDAKAILAKWNEVSNTVVKKGVSGLIDHFDSILADLSTKRMTPGRGIEPASPLPWWKITLIVAVLCVTVAAVIYCFKKENCRWILQALAAIAPAVYNIVKWGC